MSEVLIKYGEHPRIAPGTTCEACSRPDPITDHCHTHGWVRGIICKSCNIRMALLDRRIFTETEVGRLSALLAVWRRCPECMQLDAPEMSDALAYLQYCKQAQVPYWKREKVSSRIPGAYTKYAMEPSQTTINRLISTGKIKQVPPDRAYADTLLGLARDALGSAVRIHEEDPRSAYCVGLCDAVQLSMAAVLITQGLWPTSNADRHMAVYEAVRVQLDPTNRQILGPFEVMNKIRNGTEFPDSGDYPLPTTQDVQDTVPVTEAIIRMAEQVLDSMPVF